MIDLHHLPNPIPDEQLVYFLRRHPISLLGISVGALLILLSPFVGYWYISNFQTALLHDPIAFPLFLLGSSAFLLFTWLFLFQNFLDYYLDMWIVTNRRVLNIEQTGLFSRTVSALRMYRIQNVTATVTGVLHTILDFGNVEIETAGEKLRFVFEDVPHPNRVAKTILELAEEDRKEHLDTAVEEFAMPDKKKIN